VINATIFRNPFEPSTAEKTEGITDIHTFLGEQFPVWPKNARIYHLHVASSCDVTPRNEEDIERLGKLDGNIYIVLYPEGFVVVLVIIAVVLAAVSIALAFLLRPGTPNNAEQSPNNSLSDRQNTDRPQQRIPDIVGNVRSTPDEIQVPYKIFISNQEVQITYDCIGKGEYEIETTLGTATNSPSVVWDVKDDTTPLQEIAGSSFAIYGPNTSPNSGDAPQLAVGLPIDTPVVNLQPQSTVNGQILRPPNDQSVTGDNSFRANSNGSIESNDTNVDFTAYFADGDAVTLGFNNAEDPGGVQPDVDISGTYLVLNVTASTVVFANPTAVSQGWNAIANFTGGVSKYQSAFLGTTGQKWVGPFVIDVGDMTEVWCNFVAPNGLFKVSGASGNQYRIDVDVTLGITALDANYNPVGQEELYTCVIEGSAILQSQRATTLKAVLPARSDGTVGGVVQVRALRTNYTDNTWQGTNADQMQWRDLFAVSPIGVTDFGNVTTIQTLTYATASALSVQARKLNIAVTRKIATRVNGVYLPDTNLAATRNAADIIMHLSLDPFIGNRQLSEMDVDEIYDVLGTGQQVSQYFGTDLCCEFCYTFDDDQVSFEEALGYIMQATFCVAYRRGSTLSVSFEKQTEDSVLLFNHRNKIPKSETRTITFGMTNDNDGIELSYIDPFAPNYPDIDTTVTLYFPVDQSAVNPRKITAYGIRNRV